jgi:hypothetical protein
MNGGRDLPQSGSVDRGRAQEQSFTRAGAKLGVSQSALSRTVRVLALTGRDAEARETLERYLSMSEARTKTIAAFKKQINSDNPSYLAMRERICEGLRKAGMQEE